MLLPPQLGIWEVVVFLRFSDVTVDTVMADGWRFVVVLKSFGSHENRAVSPARRARRASHAARRTQRSPAAALRTARLAGFSQQA